MDSLKARTREVEGHITIDRQRYLHVNVHLNHWQLAEETSEPPVEAATELSEETPPAPDASGASDSAPMSAATGETAGQQLPVLAEPAPLELLTWIRETRRMRSEEIHFLDSPTIGVLVFFKKIEATE